MLILLVRILSFLFSDWMTLLFFSLVHSHSSVWLVKNPASFVLYAFWPLVDCSLVGTRRRKQIKKNLFIPTELTSN